MDDVTLNKYLEAFNASNGKAYIYVNSSGLAECGTWTAWVRSWFKAEDRKLVVETLMKRKLDKLTEMTPKTIQIIDAALEILKVERREYINTKGDEVLHFYLTEDPNKTAVRIGEVNEINRRATAKNLLKKGVNPTVRQTLTPYVDRELIEETESLASLKAYFDLEVDPALKLKIAHKIIDKTTDQTELNEIYEKINDITLKEKILKKIDDNTILYSIYRKETDNDLKFKVFLKLDHLSNRYNPNEVNSDFPKWIKERWSLNGEVTFKSLIYAFQQDVDHKSLIDVIVTLKGAKRFDLALELLKSVGKKYDPQWVKRQKAILQAPEVSKVFREGRDYLDEWDLNQIEYELYRELADSQKSKALVTVDKVNQFVVSNAAAALNKGYNGAVNILSWAAFGFATRGTLQALTTLTGTFVAGSAARVIGTFEYESYQFASTIPRGLNQTEISKFIGIYCMHDNITAPNSTLCEENGRDSQYTAGVVNGYYNNSWTPVVTTALIGGGAAALIVNGIHNTRMRDLDTDRYLKGVLARITPQKK